MVRYLLLLLMLASFTACGGSEEPAKTGSGSGAAEMEEEEEEGGVSLRQTYAADKATGSIAGSVKWEGTAPKRRAIDMGADKYCEKCYEGQDKPRSETAVVGANGEFANVFVYIKADGLKGWKFPKGTATRVIDQLNCRYIPHVIGAQVGDELNVKNSDSTMHNIHANPKDGGDDWFNQGQPNKGDVYKTTIDTAGFFRMKCDVHGWMTNYICVLNHPLFAVTGEDGKFTIPNVPAGTYTLVAWHEKYGTKEASITVADGAAASASFTFSK
ncbi:MAG: carboxypeptidase regulatory-like domain-containing protein [Planctomycetota bacterium]|jgi:plastocyanin